MCLTLYPLKTKKINKPQDLKGKTIGVYSLTSGTRQNLLVLLHQAGLFGKRCKKSWRRDC
ncbi:ABC transporter substrate-binding protein [Peribacillus frigoritolerans]|nr:ABC transporter substrate-binding protein [Peribacillus frigoritolerans]